MISNLNASSEAFIANMDRVQRSVENAGRQTSSGKRVNVASDAPGEIDTILQLRTDGARNTQIQENLSVAKADADAADGALTAATKLMDTIDIDIDFLIVVFLLLTSPKKRNHHTKSINI